MFDLWNGIVCTGSCAENRELYSEYYWRLDPLVRAPYCPYPYEVYVTDDVIGDLHAFEQSEFYNDFLKPRSIRSHLFINLNISGHFIGTLVITRGLKSPRFDCGDKRLAALIQPYLSASFEKTLRADQGLQQELILNLLLEEVSAKGVMVLDPSLRPMNRNRKAEAILSTFYQPGESREELPLCVKKEIEDKVHEIGDAQAGYPSHPVIKAFKLSYWGAEPQVRVSLQTTGRTALSCLLVFLELDHNEWFSLKELRESHITGRELEIVSCICEGMRNNQIAEKLCISNHTVTNHVSHIFQKLGISSRTGLCQLVLGRSDSITASRNWTSTASNGPDKPCLYARPLTARRQVRKR